MKKILISISLLPLAVFAADTNALPALAPAYGELPPSFFEQHKTAVIIGVFAFLIFAILFFLKMLRAKPVVVLPPEIVAREALEKLKRQPEDGKALSEISQTLRRYISASLQFPNAELTTGEFSAALASGEKIHFELAQSVSDFLRECDKRKFSPVNPKAPFGAANRALKLVEQIEKRHAELRAQIPTPR